jgi:hypothetical protein
LRLIHLVVVPALPLILISGCLVLICIISAVASKLARLISKILIQVTQILLGRRNLSESCTSKTLGLSGS